MTRPTTDTFSSRDAKILERYTNGATQNALAKEYGVSRQRIGQIITRVNGGAPPVVDAEIVRAALNGRPVPELAREYAARFGVQEASAARMFYELQWRPTLRYGTADNILTLLGRTELLDEVMAYG